MELENFSKIDSISIDSFYNLEDDTTSIKSLNNLLYDEVEDKEREDGEWRLSYLKQQYESLEIQSLFNRYTDRINHGYFSIFLILQTLYGLTDFGAVFYYNEANPKEVLPDLILYGSIGILPIAGLLLRDNYINNHPRALQFMSTLAFLILFFVNAFVPYYYFFDTQEHFRPTFTCHLILSSYVFFNVHDDFLAILLGAFVSLFHIVTLIMITYTESTIRTRRVLSDAIFILCLNALGIYFRYMNEIIKRKSFLDRRAWVESNFQLNHEKQQEEQLVSSIIPPYILEEVRKTINDTHIGTFQPKQYNAFTGRHDNVTILFADIVNYTEMTSKLDVKQLIKTLNELFGRFDDASEELEVLRIKFLGDCYYCVAGLPPHVGKNHGEACVDLGLKMISIISEISERRKLNINMRIGIHSGSIISGIIGISKWQYDIWSNDVDIANKMETEGVPGKVHITQQTKDLLKKNYRITPTEKGKIVPQFIQNQIQTYLISPDPETMTVKQEAPSIPNGKVSINENDTPNVRRNTIYKKHNCPPSCTDLQTAADNNNTSRSSNGSSTNPRRSITLNRSPVINYIAAQMDRDDDTCDIVGENQDVPRRRDTYYTRRQTFLNNRKDDRRYTPGTEDAKRRTAFMNNNRKRYEEMLNKINTTMEETIENMSLSKYQQWFKFSYINPIFITLKNLRSELRFMQLPDHLFKYYILAELVAICFVYLIQNITLSRWQWTSWVFYLTVSLIVFVFIPFTWTHHLWCRKFSNYDNDAPRNPIMKFLYSKSRFVTHNVYARIFIYTIICLLFTIYIFTDLYECQEDISHGRYSVLHLLMYKSNNGTSKVRCVFPWHMSQTCSLAIIMSFLFLRIHLWIKFTYASIISGIYIYIVWNFHEFYEDSETFNHHLHPKMAHMMSILFLTITLQLIDRQTNYMYRLDYLWNEHLVMEQKEATKVRNVNFKLLTNILPLHVAKIYLNVKRQPADEFYQEYYNDVAVMFASIIDYPTISKSEQVDLNNMDIDPELAILRSMNEIFVKFDRLTLGHRFGRPIEKIKITKWTYMAACGLAPGLGESETLRNDPKNHPVITILKLASEMMKQVPEFNKSCYQECKLRIGISYGKVVAGVVGSKKPLYDIWGDTVNMASRMDTTGLPNKIQVLEETAEIIQEYRYKCEYRDRIFVKGKDTLQPTYFVSLDEDFNLITNEHFRI